MMRSLGHGGLNRHDLVISSLHYRLMVGRRTLNPLILVRSQLMQFITQSVCTNVRLRIAVYGNTDTSSVTV